MKDLTPFNQASKDLELLKAAKAVDKHTTIPFATSFARARLSVFFDIIFVIPSSWWRATWEPDSVGPYDLTIHDRRRYEPLCEIVSKLPITSRVSQESRKETLTMYKIVPNTSVYIFRAYMNYHIDAFDLDCIYKPLCPSMTRQHLRKVEHLNLRTSAVPDEGFYDADLSPEDIGYKTLGNFLYYAKKRYFASLRHLNICLPTMALSIGEVRDDMSQSICRPLLFRCKNGEALRLEPMLLRPHFLDGFRVSFLDKEEAAQLGGGQPAEQHQAWLELVGVTLWDTVKPENWLEQDGVTDYQAYQQYQQLL